MKTQRKPIYKTVIFWEVLAIAIVIIGLAVAIALALKEPLVLPEQDDPLPLQTDPAATTGSTEPALPPPEANPYGPLDFKFEGDYLTCLAGESALGIDVSTWQGDINWQKVREAGVEYAIIRLGYRSTETGELKEDNYALRNYQGAADAGIRVGVYFFSQAVSSEEALEEADYVLERVKDWDLEMPIVFDWEYVSNTARTAKVDARTLTDCAKAFCQRVEDAGYESMIYFNTDQSHKQMYLEELTDYGFWLAMYDPVMTYPYKIHMWQYTDEGSVPGIAGNVDMNLYFTY